MVLTSPSLGLLINMCDGAKRAAVEIYAECVLVELIVPPARGSRSYAVQQQAPREGERAWWVQVLATGGCRDGRHADAADLHEGGL